MFARIQQGIVVEVIPYETIADRYTPQFVAECVPCGTSVTVGMTWDGETFAAPDLDAALAEAGRAERDRRLAASDWTQLADATLDDATRSAWAEYRQALRNVPQQEGFPWNINWPTSNT